MSERRSSAAFSLSLPPALAAAAGWALAVAAIAGGYVGWGWKGVVLAITVIVFWLLLQFSRALRVLRIAGQNPVGRIGSAVMFASRLHVGMKLPQVLLHSRSLGIKLGDTPETWAWADDSGDRVVAEFHHGRLATHRLERVSARGDGP
jgi:hypothetical protein